MSPWMEKARGPSDVLKVRAECYVMHLWVLLRVGTMIQTPEQVPSLMPFGEAFLLLLIKALSILYDAKGTKQKALCIIL